MSADQNSLTRWEKHRAKAAVALAIGAFSAGMAGKNTMAAMADDLRFINNAAEQSNQPNDLDNKLANLDVKIQAKIRTKSPNCYEEYLDDNGKIIIRRVVTISGYNPDSGSATFTQVVEQIEPGEELPLSVGVYIGTKQARYNPDEKFEYANVVYRDKDNPGDYSLASLAMEDNGNMRTIVFKNRGSKPDTTINTQEKFSHKILDLFSYYNNVIKQIDSLIDIPAVGEVA